MAKTVIQVENISKKYIINHQAEGDYSTLRDKITEGAKSLGRLITPGKKNDRSTCEEFWALKDVSFEVKQGDRLGIIGRNGAGKSTLLKILSRITEPTTGEITIHGRVASLLEVGTGFHPELTGRENIYLNGAILGMSKVETKKKFDEIVAFAEIEKFLDTPVKRYSSGMYVRLAFAVAAHLEPEILIVDEVLAVGDVQFQKKCLGKMQEVSENEGRTVLFVSHSIDSIKRLCSKTIILEEGELVLFSTTNEAIQKYIATDTQYASPTQWIDISKKNRLGTREAFFGGVKFTSLEKSFSYQAYSNGPLEFYLKIQSDRSRVIGSLAISFFSQNGSILINADSLAIGKSLRLDKGINLFRLKIKKLHLRAGVYNINLWLDKTGSGSGNDVLDYIESAFEIEVFSQSRQGLGAETIGVVTCDFDYIKESQSSV